MESGLDTSALQSMFPETSKDAIRFALRSRRGNVDEAISYLLDESFAAEFAAVSAHAGASISAGSGKGSSVDFSVGVPAMTATDRDVKARLMARYDEVVDTSDKTYRPALPAAAKVEKRQMRYWCGVARFSPAG